MTTRHLYVVRHGAADVFGELTDVGRQQMNLLGERLAGIPITAVWHSPLSRGAASAQELARHVPDAGVSEAAELIDHVPYVPSPAEMPPSWAGFFDGYDDTEAATGQRTAEALTDRFATAPDQTADDVHEVLITHAYQVAWLVVHAMDAPPARWLGLNSSNAGLTVIEYRLSTPAALVMFNDMSHLPAELRWTGFPDTTRP